MTSSVTESASPELKEVLSTSRKTRSASVPAPESSERISTPSIVRVPTPHNKAVPWRSELNELSETIYTLTADMLGMKQLYNANESSRSAQMLELRDSITVVSNGIAEFKHQFSNTITNVQNCLLRVESVQSSSLVALKNDMKVVKQDIKLCEESLLHVETSVKKSLMSLEDKRGKTV